MLGAIVGDIIGSPYEFNNYRGEDFPLFTDKSHFPDDSVLSIALADRIINNISYTEKLKEYYRLYPYCSYGGNFQIWAGSENTRAYNSWGNGSAMRVSPIGWAYDDTESVLLESKKSAAVTHNHPEGIKGAQATARGGRGASGARGARGGRCSGRSASRSGNDLVDADSHPAEQGDRF